MKIYNKLRPFIVLLGISIALLSTRAYALGSINLLTAPKEVITTISEVVLDQTDGQLRGANVLADNDRRLLYIYASKASELRDLMDARRNGWEVLLKLESGKGKSLNGAHFYIESVEILSRENKLSIGLLTEQVHIDPIVATSKSDLFNIFDSVYPYKYYSYDVNDDCFNRAHFWSRTYEHNLSSKNQRMGTDKVFIFFSQAYTKKYDHNWWYHVAPMVYYQNTNFPYVIDPTFIDDPLSLQQWLEAFDPNTDGRCIEINSLEEYMFYNSRPVCMYLRTSMFSYIPSDLRGQRRLRNWRCGDFRGVKKIPAPGSETHNPNATWADPEFNYLIPPSCRF